MDIRFLAPVAVVALALAGCAKEEQYAVHKTTRASESLVATEGPAVLQGTAIVRMRPEVADGMVKSHAAMRSAVEPFEAIGVKTMDRLYADGGEFEARHREAGLHEWYRVTFEASRPVSEMLSELSSMPGVVSVEPERRVKLHGSSSTYFNDTYYGKLWGIKNTEHSGVDINVETVWSKYTAGSSDVIVAVIDGGIDTEHEDLAAVTIPGSKDGSKNFVSNSYRISAHTHGTHVAGTIGAVSNNGKGIAGIAGGKDGKGGVKLLSCQVFETQSDGKDKSASNFGDAFVWAADHGAVIAQNSWGYQYDKESDALNGSAGAVASSIDYFIKYAGTDKNGNQTGPMKGGLVTFSSGNDDFSIGWPAAYDKVVAVGAIGKEGYRADFSNYGSWVDICAPGVSICSCIPGDYGFLDGTSMACPHVSGVAALLVSYYGGQGFTCDMLREKLIAGANTKYPANSKSKPIGGLVDAYGSFSVGGTTPPDKVSSYSATPHSNTVEFEWKVTSDSDDGKAYGYLLLASPDKSDFSGINYRSLPASMKSAGVEVGDVKAGAAIKGTLTGLEFDSPYYVSIVGYDYGKNYSDLAEIVQIRTGINHAPEISTSYSGDYKVKSHLTLNVPFTISDPDGHAVTVQFTPGSSSATLSETGTDSWQLTIVGNSAQPGTYDAVVKAQDSYGLSVCDTVTYTVLENHAPVMSRPLENLIFEQTGVKKVINMNEYITDEDGEQIRYSMSFSPKGIVQVVQSDSTLRLTTITYGRATVDIVAKDCRTQTPISFQVLVRDPDSGVDTYPNPVDSVLNVSAGVMSDFVLTMTNSAGAQVFEDTLQGSAFEPARIDMRDYAPGRYGLRIMHGGKIYDKTVIKL